MREEAHCGVPLFISGGDHNAHLGCHAAVRIEPERRARYQSAMSFAAGAIDVFPLSRFCFVLPVLSE